MGSAERERLARELDKLAAEIGRAEERLGNEQFVSRAPAQVLEGNRRRLAELQERRERILAALGDPGSAGAAGA